MSPERKRTINGHKVEEFYWNGGFPVYVDNRLADGSFEQVCARLEREARAP